MENNTSHKIECSSALNELFAALAKAQGEMRIADKSSNNPFFKSKYADLASVIDASRQFLTKNGLSVIQMIDLDNNGKRILVTILGHSSGQFLSSRLPINPTKEDIQSFGSAITYLRRYAYASLVGVVADQEDDDGEVAMKPVRAAASSYEPKKEQRNGGGKISFDQLDILKDELGRIKSAETKANLLQNILKFFGIKELEDLPRDRFTEVLNRVRNIIENENS